jgi:hypothetical protein
MAETQTAAAQAGQATTTETPGKISAALLKLVQRPQTKDGKVVMEKGEPKLRQVRADEVLSWKEYADHVVVVTTDGQKYVGAKETK